MRVGMFSAEIDPPPMFTKTETFGPIPEIDPAEQTCPKCHANVTPRWHAACSKGSVTCGCNCGYSAKAKTGAEHLHYTCRCGFDWTTAPFDAEAVAE